jgi:cytochrome c5
MMVAERDPVRPHAMSWFALVLIAILPLVAWSSNTSTEEPGHVGTEPVVDQPGIAGTHETSQPVNTTLSPLEQTAPTEAAAGQTASDRFDLALGRSVFNHTCLTCHGNSVRDAPRVGDMHVWQPRLAQGLDVLIQHALHGHGRMPAKGGYSSLTDYEVSSAVAYVYQVGTEILAKQEAPVSHTGCDPATNLDECTPAELKRLLVLQMLWLLGGPRQ